MNFVAIDTETENFAPGDQAPRLVCVSISHADRQPELYDHVDGLEVVDLLLDEAIESPDEDPIVLTLQNGPYDWAVLMRAAGEAGRGLEFTKKIFALHDAQRVWDTRTVEWVLDNAEGVLHLQPWSKSPTGYRRPPKGSGWYSLGRLSEKYLFTKLEKGEGSVRTNFGYLRGVSISKWPQEHIDYAKADADVTRRVSVEQLARARNDGRNVLADVPAQLKAYLALHLISVWGLTTDLPMVAAYKTELESTLETMREKLSGIELVVDGVRTRLLTQKRGKRKPVKDEGKWQTSMKVLRALIASAFKRQGLEVPMTEPSVKFPEGQVATDAETIEDCEDESLAPWKAYKKSEKILSTYVPVLEQGIVHPRYDFTSNGRVAHFDPNIGNLPRKGKVRECYVARDGTVMCSTDYGSQELVTFAQVMHWTIGPNALSDALNDNLDPHMMLAATRLGIDYDEGVRRRKAGDRLVIDHRQKSKGPNFGYPGGMGPEKFCLYMRQQDPPEIYTIEEAEEERANWFSTWNNDPRRYFRWVSSQVDEQDWIRQFVSKRIRGGGRHGPGVGFTDGANGFFSALAADMSKAATYEVVRRCYTGVIGAGFKGEGKPSALYGSRVIVMVHDELIAELLLKNAHEAAMEMADVMLQCGKRYCPDVKSKVEPALFKRWYKSGDAVYDVNGRLIPWEPAHE